MTIGRHIKTGVIYIIMYTDVLTYDCVTSESDIYTYDIADSDTFISFNHKEIEIICL
jgi:hypothetical protein